ncbi:MAG: OmpA family protein [Rhodospirillales bacterium]|nr:OmpA family protein [Rhodospirillales bacterium]
MRTARHKIRSALPAALVLLLAGCGSISQTLSFDYPELHRVEPQGKGFPAALARQYRDIALFEAEQMYDWPDAAYFGDKALKAASGQAVAPDRPDRRALPVETVGTLTAAHARLGAVLKDGAAKRRPADAARAQVNYDCWLEQQEENWQTSHIARCRNGFESAMKTLERDGAVTGERRGAGLHAAALTGSGTDNRATPNVFTLFFNFNSTAINADGWDAIQAAVQASESLGPDRPVRIRVDGHADRAGSKTYNLGVSHRRAEAVRYALIKNGISQGHITSLAFGENRPSQPTPDGMRHPRNRRVEISIAPASGL